MNYYWFNRQEILQKAKERYSKEKSAEYYKQNKEVIKGSQEIVIKTCQKKKKTKLKSIKRRGIKNLFNMKKKRLKDRSINLSVGNIIMGEKTLKCSNIKVNKKEFHKSK